MHFIVSPFGSAGDVHPFLGLALALKRRGHDITFVVNGYFTDVAERHGVDVVEFGTREEFLEKANHPDLWNPLKSFQYMYHQLILPSIPKQYDLFAEAHQQHDAIGISNCLGFGSLVAQEKLGMPVVTVHLQPAVIWSRFAPPTMPHMFGPRWLRSLQYHLAERIFIDPIVKPPFNRLRAEMGLPPMSKTTRWWHSRWCVACLFPEWYCSPQPDWPAHLLQTDFPLWDDRQDDGLSAEVETFLAAGEPPIAFTPGSANMFGREFFATAVEVCRRSNRRGMLLSRFADQIPASLPEGVQHFSYVPFGPLLPRTAAVVHHGGVGSTAQGFAGGIPQFVMALSHDQFDNGERVKRLGVGDWLKASKFTPDRLTPKLQALLASPEVKRSCRTYAEKLAPHDGLDRMAAAIEQRAERREPAAMPR